MKALLSTLSTVALLGGPTLAHASPESDRLAALEARIAALEASQAPAPQPTPRVSPRYVNAARALLGYRMAAFGSPLFGATITGGGSVSSAGMPDPYTPPDGTWNVTGAITASNAGAFGSNATVGNGGGSQNLIYFSSVAEQGMGASGSGATGRTWVRGANTDGASAIGVMIQAHADLTTSGAKIASFGDNAGTSYSEKAYFNKDGGLHFVGGVKGDTAVASVSTDGTDFYVNSKSGGYLYVQQAGSTIAHFGAEVALKPSGTERFKVTSNTRAIVTPPSTYGFDLDTSGSKVTCDATNRGSLFYEEGGAGVKDTLYVCSKQASGDSYAWRDIAAPIP